MEPLHVVYLVSTLIIGKIVCEGNECSTPQFIETGSVGFIQCSFPDDVSRVLWYKFSSGAAFLTLVNSVKSGEGFRSGEFDVHPNGSLIIRHVLMNHEGTYRVVRQDTPSSEVKQYFVTVFVFAQTFSRVPVIDNCDNKSEICFQMLSNTSEISCTIKDARPAIPLRWMLRDGDGDRNISSRLLIKNGTHPFLTSRVTITNAFVYPRILTLLVCKANDPSGLLQKNESLILIQGSDETLPKASPQVVFAKRNTRVELSCNNMSISCLVWQIKQSQEVVFKTLLYAVFVGEHFHHLFNDDYRLQRQSTFVVDNVKEHHEGTYRCISSNEFEDGVNIYEVVVFVYPDPAYPVVDGCNHQQYCVLKVHSEGSLTCTVKGIRPRVQLDITEVFERSSNVLQFYDKTITIKDHGDTSDVLLTSKYRCNSVTESRLTIECKVIGTNIEELHLSTKFDLLIFPERMIYYTTTATGAESTTDGAVSSDGHSYWIIAVVLIVVPVFLVMLLIVKVRCRRGRKRRLNCFQHRMINRVLIPMISRGQLQGKKDMLISELKVKYQDLYDAVQPIPYIRDRLYCVNRVFVEGGIEYLVAIDRIGEHGTWEKLCSYHNILDDDRVKSTRRIIEGEPGYGKSTLTLQLSYDWCNKIPLSYLKDIDVLILLRLRQLGGVTSVYRAIKQFLLPKDSKLTESDIADIISECSSVLVILDGYDEYPDQDVDVDSDVISIIMRNMFQKFEVILTTRSSYLPKKCPALTKRLKLTGFDDNARDQYIRKAVVGDDVTAAEKIKQRLKENPVLGDLCQVPLFFVMFAHMSHESEQFQKFNSVTSFFRYMISCFHSHMKNKMGDENVKKYDLFETDHAELDKLAFEGLSRKDQQIVWSKHYMCERLGRDFYDQYVRIGILVEEEVLDISEDPNAIISEHIQYKAEVRFYHKLFCEWYAAHHLSEYASRNDVTFDPWEESEGSEGSYSVSDKDDEPEYRNGIESQTDHYLKYLDPFDLQYVYRFACGLNSTAAYKIIGYLKTREDAKKFAVLCIFEKSGRVEGVIKDVKDLCAKNVDIDINASLLLQRSTIQLLEIATANKVTLKMESTAFVLGAQHKQWSRENKPVSHNWKKGRGRLDLNQLVGNWDVKPHLT
ncbi:NLR family CARD domain-containing protein 4 [Holothuria leucospilota]|uniref:NLR family CARD domain-containing protein 4 n=1 Tax=Holothuria leucospilota TaxID=206669 RepID=A0A9Q0YHB3_HOLLE|nr:NLR family CARD domain-containing protein 4 [Holothuria leucospilota]